MKKIILLSGLLIFSAILISFISREEKNPVMYASMMDNLTVRNQQGQTWLDVKEEIDSILGKKMVKLTPELKAKFLDCIDLYQREWGSKRGPSVAPDMGFLQFCWECRCVGSSGHDPINGCGYSYREAAGCSFWPIACYKCPNCTWGYMDAYVGSCSLCLY